MENINVENIMAQIRKEIVEKGYTAGEPSFVEMGNCVCEVADFDAKQLSAALQQAGNSFVVNWYLPIGGNPVAIFVKKCLRKLMIFFVKPLVEQQNKYNAASLQALAQLAAFARENAQLRAEVSELKKQLTDGEKKA